MAQTLGALARGFSTLSLTGICKNAGKTTALNALLAEYRGQTTGLTSIGRDGEDTDEVTKTPKPRIYVKCGTLVATAERLLPKCDITKQLVHASGIATPLGEVVVVRALSDGFVELAGPSTAEGTSRIIGTMLSLGAQRVLADGAVSRRSFVRATDAAVLCAGASYSPDINETVDETAYFARLLGLKKTDAADCVPPGGSVTLVGEQTREIPRDGLAGALGACGDVRAVVFGGAITDGIADALASRGGLELVAAHAGSILLSREKYDRLERSGCAFSVIKPTALAAVCANPYSAYGDGYDPADFVKRLKRALDVPVFDLCATEVGF